MTENWPELGRKEAGLRETTCLWSYQDCVIPCVVKSTDTHSLAGLGHGFVEIKGKRITTCTVKGRGVPGLLMDPGKIILNRKEINEQQSQLSVSLSVSFLHSDSPSTEATRQAARSQCEKTPRSSHPSPGARTEVIPLSLLGFQHHFFSHIKATHWTCSTW